MSRPLLMIATAVVAYALGRLTALPTIHRLRHQLADTHRSMLYDPLTGMLNRAGLRAVHAALAERALAQPITVALIDLDDFKHVNDTHGHDHGDDLLIAIGDRITDLATIHGGAAARLAGDEYAVLLPTHAGDPDRIADALATIIAEPVALGTDEHSVTASIGLAIVEATDPLTDVALHRADVAMYHAKRNGRNRHATYQPGMTMPPAPHRRGPRLRDRRRPIDGAPA
ncbi:GGDEF domain-containing protein [Micromonospora aurantiaca]|uniref:GGDEF domain-containing protein n=1 Tax=Micromonospora aurantiaca (nom. illeg.) TaxID=47850 RepID=A0ABQ6UNJ6_9ACTN|nr:GGDEF domain-containing protein [Micromonospora aurantiaca]KAB1118471.1 GGDEF domain-containing protein [Micromonospora aurantiaca]